MKKIFNVFLSCFLLAILISCGGGSENVRDDNKQGKTEKSRAQATGVATIFDNDIALARDRALDDAKSQLVKIVIGENVSGESVVENYELVSNIIKSQSYGLVKNMKILKEGKLEDSAYSITIEGDVEPGVVADAIEAALERYGKPKFMVLVDEKIENEKNTPGMTVTELSMMEIMGNSGFEFVDAATTQDLMKKDKAKMLKATTGTVSEDVQDLLLDDAGAEVIIYGSVKVTDQSHVLKDMTKNMLSKVANINLKAVDVYTGDIIASATADAPGLNIDSNTAARAAIKNCLSKNNILGKNDENGKFKPGKFMETIVKKFVQAANNRQIKMFVTGLEASDFRHFKDQISNRVRGVQKVEEKGRDGKAAKLVVEFAGKTHDFEQELSAKSSAMGFEINVSRSRPNKLIMTATKIDKQE